MKDTKRSDEINEICDLIREIRAVDDSLRFGQLLTTIEYLQFPDGMTGVETNGMIEDPYEYKDSYLATRLKDWLKKRTNGKIYFLNK